ncbi:MAG: thermonuclease family protein [Patescibacteria group bacterium]|nr:thermonuclease family protein [Patescibacteria group bacterium]
MSEHQSVSGRAKISVSHFCAIFYLEKNEKFSQKAIDYLTQTALNQKATLDYQPNYATDAWSRTVAFVFINDIHLNEQLIRQGYCTATIYKKRAKLKYQDEFLNAQDQANQEKLGKWK